MTKIKLLYRAEDYPSFDQGWFRPVVTQYFDWVKINTDPTVSPSDTVVITTYQNESAEWLEPYRQAGFKIVIEHLWDSHIFRTNQYNGNQMTLYCKNWIWYNESVWYRFLGYDQYCPARTNTHAFLLLMHKERPHRDRILEVLTPLLGQSLYSYVSRGIRLPDDSSYSPGGVWYNYFNPNWYNSTAFSVVSESYLRSPTDISEKIFKPLAYYHPFVVYGSSGSLEYLHSQGFETYSNLFDESYDTIVDENERFDAVTQQVFQATDRWTRGEFYIDSVTQQKLDHNHSLFFNSDRVMRGIEQEIFQPIVDFFES